MTIIASVKNETAFQEYIGINLDIAERKRLERRDCGTLIKSADEAAYQSGRCKQVK